MDLYELGAQKEEQHYGSWAIIAANSESEARSLAIWDYNDETTYCKLIEDVSATGNPRVIFHHWG